MKGKLIILAIAVGGGSAGGLVAGAFLLWLAQARGEWLGFAGSVIGGLFTVLAAYIAWRGVRLQISEARAVAEIPSKNAALKIMQFAKETEKTSDELQKALGPIFRKPNDPETEAAFWISQRHKQATTSTAITVDDADRTVEFVAPEIAGVARAAVEAKRRQDAAVRRYVNLSQNNEVPALPIQQAIDLVGLAGVASISAFNLKLKIEKIYPDHASPPA